MTPRGERALAPSDTRQSMRHLILDHIDADNPPWLQLASYGRKEVLKQAPGGVSQIIVEAGLGHGDDKEVVHFWDELAARARGMRSAALMETGRAGERLSLAHEKSRTNSNPKWIALDDNAAGYDVLSKVSAVDLRNMTIEVKATTQRYLSGHFHISRNEWSLAEDSRFHKFHLWDISHATPLLAALDLDDIKPHVPCNSGAGEWESVCIPFLAFKDSFLPAEILPD